MGKTLISKSNIKQEIPLEDFDIIKIMNSPMIHKGSTITEILNKKKKELERELGVEQKIVKHYKRPEERIFKKSERPFTTILFGGLTWKHEKLIRGVLRGLGYKAEELPTPDKQSFQIGKEFGNNGLCNPTYFTVGNLIKYLQDLEKKGLTKEEIIDKYVFFTAGACGPCRFGMYEAEYRLALRNSGFGGFRVLIFQQKGGLSQEEFEAGLEMNLDFFLGLINAMNIADVLNDIAYQIRPYEIIQGETDKVLIESMEIMYDKVFSKKYFNFNSRLGKILKSFPASDYIIRLIEQIYSDHYISSLNEIKRKFSSIQVDHTRVKPICKITGEFWAQTTEGDGNFKMFSFLEREGAQVLVEPIATWILYMLHQGKNYFRERRDIKETKNKISQHLKSRFNNKKDFVKYMALLSFAEKVFTSEYNKLRKIFSNLPHQLTNQLELQRIAHPYYHTSVEGGEGHLEVAKNIYYANKYLCHMVVSLKPFGCMPSTQSDGVQSAVTSHYKDMLFIPIETSGEGDINAYSRIQMALGEAKNKAKNEFNSCLKSTGFTLNEIKDFISQNPYLENPFYKIKQRKGIVGVAANFILEVADKMKACGKKTNYKMEYSENKMKPAYER